MKRKPKILVACETSGRVREAFRKQRCEAYSCDLLPAEDKSPHHILGDALSVINVAKFDLIIAHPPCTYLCNSGVRWLFGKGKARKGKVSVAGQTRGALSLHPDGPYSVVDHDRWLHMKAAVDFFREFLPRQIGARVCIENPIPHKHARLPAYTQIIQPWHHGHPETKATCLWLYGLPKLTRTNVVVPTKGSAIHKLPPSKDRWKIRSRTYQGIADAMAQQWAPLL